MPLQNTLPLPNFNMLGWNCIFEVDTHYATPSKRLEIQQRGAKITFHKSAAVCIRQHGAFSLSLFPSDCNAITTVDGWGKSYTDIIARTRGSRQRRNEEDRNAGRFCESHLLTTSGCEDEFTQPRDHSVAEPHGGNAIDFEHNAERKRTGSNCLPVPKRDCIPKKTLAPSFSLPLASIIAVFLHQICAPPMNFDDRHHFAIFAQRGEPISISSDKENKMTAPIFRQISIYSRHTPISLLLPDRVSVRAAPTCTPPARTPSRRRSPPASGCPSSGCRRCRRRRLRCRCPTPWWTCCRWRCSWGTSWGPAPGGAAAAAVAGGP